MVLCAVVVCCTLCGLAGVSHQLIQRVVSSDIPPANTLSLSFSLPPSFFSLGPSLCRLSPAFFSLCRLSLSLSAPLSSIQGGIVPVYTGEDGGDIKTAAQAAPGSAPSTRTERKVSTRAMQQKSRRQKSNLFSICIEGG